MITAHKTGPQLVGLGRTRKAGPQIVGYGFGAASADYNSFLQADQSATYTDATGQVFCNKLPIGANGEPQCVLSSYGANNPSSPVVAMQMATDAFLNQVPAFHLILVANGQQLQQRGADGTVGTVSSQSASLVGDQFVMNPIKTKGGGYDGVVGPGTIGMTALAVSIAGSLATFPDNVAIAFVGQQEDMFALYAQDIANYLNNVTANFSALLAQYMQAYTPAPALVPTAIPLVAKIENVPLATAKPKTALYVGGAIAASAAIAGIGAVLTRKSEREKMLFPEGF